MTVPDFARDWNQSMDGRVWYASWFRWGDSEGDADVVISRMNAQGTRLAYDGDGLWFVIRRDHPSQDDEIVISPGYTNAYGAMRWWHERGRFLSDSSRGIGAPGDVWTDGNGATAREFEYVNQHDGTILRMVRVADGMHEAIASGDLDRPIEIRNMWQLAHRNGEQIGHLHESPDAAKQWWRDHSAHTDA